MMAVGSIPAVRSKTPSHMPKNETIRTGETDLEPLISALQVDLRVTEPTHYPRGCLLPDGRLDLCKQALGPELACKVTSALEGNSFVRSLLVGANRIGDEGAEAIGTLLKRGSPLSTVFVGCNLIGPRGAERLISSSAWARDLRGLWLKRNAVGTGGVHALVHLLEESRSLRTLDLVQTGLSREDLAAVSRAASTSSSLRWLYLGANQLDDATPIAELIADNVGLEALFAGSQPLGDRGAEQLAEAIGANQGLHVLGLQSGAIGPRGTIALARAAIAHPGLRRLSLGWAPATRQLQLRPNQIEARGAAALAELLRCNSGLETLDLGGNDLTEDAIAGLVDALEHNEHLLELRVDRASPTLARRLRGLLERNRAHRPKPRSHPDVAAIRSVYRARTASAPAKPPPHCPPPQRVALDLPEAQEIERATELLERLARSPQVFFEHPQALRGLRAAANRMISGIIDEAKGRKDRARSVTSAAARRLGRAERKQRDQKLLERTALRQQRSGASHPPVTAEEPLARPRSCYVCKSPYVQLHHFYHALCRSCGDAHFAKREATADLDGRTALLTGGRLKIGRQIALKLLRAGATTIITTRFPRDAARRYAAEPDFRHWSERLQIVGIDLRHLPSVEGLAEELGSRPNGLDILINNAAQTIRRPPGFYAQLERDEAMALPEPLSSMVIAPVPSPSRTLELAHADMFPPGRLEDDGQQLDLRPTNSWRLSVGEVSTRELLEVHVVNCLAPFLLVRGLLPILERSKHPRRFIINVSAMEGSFSRPYKSAAHPHTNMAKAALNMLTRTSASGLLARGIFTNSVDTGWVTNEQPFPVRERMRAELGFSPPLDEIDGASRVLDPIFQGLSDEAPLSGQFLKDYVPVPW